jgi:hypothetical protein
LFGYKVLKETGGSECAGPKTRRGELDTARCFEDLRLAIGLLRACGMIRRFKTSRHSPSEFQTAVLGNNPIPPAVKVVIPLVNLFERAYV